GRGVPTRCRDRCVCPEGHACSTRCLNQWPQAARAASDVAIGSSPVPSFLRTLLVSRDTPATSARAGARTSDFVGVMLYCSRESRSVRADLKGLPHVPPPWRSPAARPIAEVPVHHLARTTPLFRAPGPDWGPVDLARCYPARTARLALGARHDPVELARR